MAREIFPATRHSAVLAAASADPEVRARSRDVIAGVYYKPVYAHVRLKWRKTPEEAEELAQSFFAHAFETGLFAGYDPARGRFRTFVRVCLDRLVAKEGLAARRLKRGGAHRLVSADVAELEQEIERAASTPAEADALFDREWVRSLFATSVEELSRTLESAGKRTYFEVFRRYDLDDAEARPSYAEVASALGIKPTDVTNYLHQTRKTFRRIVLDRIRELTGSEEEFREEARAVLGVEP